MNIREVEKRTQEIIQSYNNISNRQSPINSTISIEEFLTFRNAAISELGMHIESSNIEEVVVKSYEPKKEIEIQKESKEIVTRPKKNKPIIEKQNLVKKEETSIIFTKPIDEKVEEDTKTIEETSIPVVIESSNNTQEDYDKNIVVSEENDTSFATDFEDDTQELSKEERELRLFGLLKD